MQRLKNFIANLKYLTRFNIIVGLIFVLVVVALVNIFQIRSVHEHTQKLNQQRYNQLENLKQLQNDILKLVMANQFNNSEYRSLVQIRKNSAMMSEQIQQVLTTYRENITDENELIIYDELTNELENYKNLNREISSLYAAHKDSLAASLKNSREKRAIEQMNAVFDKLQKNIDDKYRLAEDQIKQQVDSFVFSTFAYIILSSLIALVVTLLFVRDIPNDFERLKRFLENISQGQIDHLNVSNQSKNEFVEIEHIANHIAGNVSQIQEVTKKMASGNFDFDFQVASKNDVVGNSILELKQNLQKTKKDELERYKQEQNRNWQAKGLALFSDLLRQQTHNLNELADIVIRNLVKYLDANQGGVFLVNDKNPDDLHLELSSAFAYDRKKFFVKRIEFGEGLVGMVVLEKNTVFITDVPQDYLEIESGLGESSPSNLLIVPLKLENDVLGVLEIASFKVFSKTQIQFVEQLAESVASTLSSVKINAKTAKLLQQSQQQADELAKREQELRINMREIKATQEEAARKGAEMMGILTAVDFALLKVEYDKEGNLLTANQRFLNTMEYMLDEIKKKNIETFIPDELIQKFRLAWKNLLQGNAYKTTYKTYTKTGKEIWLLAQYTPVFDENKNILKVLYLANDITEQKQIEEAAKKQALQLEKQEADLEKNLQALKQSQKEQLKKELEVTGLLTAIDNALIKVEYNSQGKLIDANQIFRNIFGVSQENINEITFTSFDQPNENNQNVWNHVITNSSYTGVLHLRNRYNNSIWLLASLVAMKNSENELDKILLLANDITKQMETEAEIRANAEILKEQENQMRLNMEEMMQIQEEMAKTEAEMRGFIEAIDHTLVKGEYDKDGIIQNVNQLFLDTLGYQSHEIIGKHVLSIVPEEDHPQFELMWPKFLNGEATRNLTVRRLAKDKSIVWMLMSCTPIRNESDDVYKILFLAKDVTAQKNIEESYKTQTLELIEKEQNMKQNMEELIHIQEESIKLKDQLEQADQKIRDKFETEIAELYRKWIDSLK